MVFNAEWYAGMLNVNVTCFACFSSPTKEVLNNGDETLSRGLRMLNIWAMLIYVQFWEHFVACLKQNGGIE